MGDRGDKIRLDLEDLYFVSDRTDDEGCTKSENQDKGDNGPEVETFSDIETTKAFFSAVKYLDLPRREIICKIVCNGSYLLNCLFSPSKISPERSDTTISAFPLMERFSIIGFKISEPK